MNTFDLLKDVTFNEHGPHAEPVQHSTDGRVIRFALQPGQILREHHSPHSPVHVVVVSGRGLFKGANGEEQEAGAGTLVTFAEDEHHAVHALDVELVFVAILSGAQGAHREE